MSVLPACVGLCTLGVECVGRPEEGFEFPQIGDTDSHELLCGCWEKRHMLWRSSKCSSLLSHPPSPASQSLVSKRDIPTETLLLPSNTPTSACSSHPPFRTLCYCVIFWCF